MRYLHLIGRKIIIRLFGTHVFGRDNLFIAGIGNLLIQKLILVQTAEGSNGITKLSGVLLYAYGKLLGVLAGVQNEQRRFLDRKRSCRERVLVTV